MYAKRIQREFFRNKNIHLAHCIQTKLRSRDSAAQEPVIFPAAASAHHVKAPLFSTLF